jgi:hypothetical protein
VKPLVVTGRVLNPNETFKRLNPSLFGVGAVATTERKQDPAPALVKNPRPQRSRKGRVEVIVSIISCRPGQLDDDSASSGGVKALRDIIAETLGYDDGDRRIRFQYGQCETIGETGCLVRIELA